MLSWCVGPYFQVRATTNSEDGRDHPVMVRRKSASSKSSGLGIIPYEDVGIHGVSCCSARDVLAKGVPVAQGGRLWAISRDHHCDKISA